MRHFCFSRFLVWSAFIFYISPNTVFADNFPSVTAVKSYSFIDSIGVNTHLNDMWSNDFYANIQNVESEITFINVRYARDTFSGHTQLPAMQQLNRDTGLLFDIIFHSDFSYATQLADLRSNSSMVAEVEGPNEVDKWTTVFNNLTGYNASIAMQKTLYTDVKTFVSTAQMPVHSLTISNPSNLASVGNLSSYADDANVHYYAQWGGYWGAFVYPSSQWSLSTFGVLAPGKPQIMTESGWWTLPGQGGVTENVQAKFILNLLFDTFLQGVKRTYIYQLNDEYADPQGSNLENHFGLFNFDGSPKIAANALHNLMALIQDNVKTFVPSSLSYSISGLPDSGAHQLLIQKSNGNFIIAVWNETMFWDNIATAETPTIGVPITVTLANPAKIIRVFDPLVNTTAMIWKNNASSADLQLTDHPLLIIVTP